MNSTRQANFQPVIINTSFLDPHPLYPDISSFLTAQWSTGCFFVGSKVTPSDNDEDRFVARYYRELDNDAIVVEIRPSANAAGEIEEMIEMSCAEYAWLLGCPVNDLSVTSAISESESDQFTNNTLYQSTEEPSAGYISANFGVGADTSGVGPEAGKSLFPHKNRVLMARNRSAPKSSGRGGGKGWETGARETQPKRTSGTTRRATATLEAQSGIRSRVRSWPVKTGTD